MALDNLFEVPEFDVGIEFGGVAVAKAEQSLRAGCWHRRVQEHMVNWVSAYVAQYEQSRA